LRHLDDLGRHSSAALGAAAGDFTGGNFDGPLEGKIVAIFYGQFGLQV
jgi:hypothetical protein